MEAVTSIADLRVRAIHDEQYLKLALIATSNLGKKVATLADAIRWLAINAAETDEEGVVDEINSCRDFVK
jgi:hypothetical protein